MQVVPKVKNDISLGDDVEGREERRRWTMSTRIAGGDKRERNEVKEPDGGEDQRRATGAFFDPHQRTRIEIHHSLFSYHKKVHPLIRSQRNEPEPGFAVVVVRRKRKKSSPIIGQS